MVETDDIGRQMGDIVGEFQFSAKFYDDHLLRDLPSGRTVKVSPKGGTVTVQFDLAGLDDLVEDATMYGGNEIGLDPEFRSLVRSAQQLIARLDKQGALELLDPGTAARARKYINAGTAGMTEGW